MKTVTKSVIDLIVEAAKNKELIDIFKNAKSAKELQKRWLDTEPGYSLKEEDCKKLFKGKKEIIKALETYNEKGFY